MKLSTLRTVAAFLLALPLIVFGSNYFLHFFPIPPGDGGPGDQLLQLMRCGGFMSPLAFSHVLAGVAILIPRTRFLGGLLQLPICLGILAFHCTMLPAGNVMAIILLVLNLAVLAEPAKWKELLA